MIDKTFAFVQSSPLLFQLFLQESPAAECLVGSSVSWSAQPPTLCSVFTKGELHSQPLVPLLCDSNQRVHVFPKSLKATDGGMAGVVAEDGDDTQKFQCFPLASVLLAVGNTTVNLLSLDIEGAEIQVFTIQTKSKFCEFQDISENT